MRATCHAHHILLDLIRLIISGEEYNKQGYFVTERAGTPFRKFFLQDASRNGVQESLFHGVGLTRLGVSCYHTTLVLKKLAYFVQFLKEKVTPFDRILGHCMRSGIYFFRKIALLKNFEF
jgi:hypothetical protein